MKQEMKERPIIFSKDMVVAILEDRKTQTRRALRKQPADILPMLGNLKGTQWCTLRERLPKNEDQHGDVIRCRFGLPGDRLWVKETWCNDKDQFGLSHIKYKADPFHPNAGFVWKSSLFMPRWASRITLEIVNIRVERLQSITEDECKKEGITSFTINVGPRSNPQNCYPAFPDKDGGFPTAKQAFERLWDSINAKKGFGWDTNPWVWVIEFTRMKNAE